MTPTTTLDEELEVLIAYEAWVLEQNEKTIDTSVGAYARHLERERALEEVPALRERIRLLEPLVVAE